MSLHDLRPLALHWLQAPNARALRWAVAALLLAGLALLVADRLWPLPALAHHAPSGTLVVLARDGTPLRTWAGSDERLRQPVQPEQVSPLYLQALLSYEDRWFHWHPGINPVALVRAAWQWARQGRIVSGGSTLSMQVARLLEPHAAGRSVPAKLRQMLRALQLEAHLSKREILTLYLNHAPMGGQVVGVEMAARAYLGKGASDLSAAEAALLVALPQTPSRLRPDRAAPLARAARDKVLQRMATLGVWSAASVADARIETVFAPPLRARWLAPLAAERLRQQMRRRSGGAAPQPATLTSTLDASVQWQLEQVLTDRLGSLPEQVSIAALVVDNATLQVRGYAGSADFHDAARAAHVDMVRGVRSPGSTLKPFAYAMALDDGLVHSESLLIDAPQNFGGYAPGNFESSFSGAVSVSEALQRSLNVPAVDLLDRIGPARFAAHLRNAGLRLRMPEGAAPNLSLILGGGGTTLEELVGAYTALARGGVAGRLRLTPDDPLIETRLMSEGAAFIVREILENGGRPDAPFRETAQRVAWKTGTSFGFRDAWAVGVTDAYTVGIWVGRPDGTPNPGHFGANTAAPLVKDLLAALGPSATKPRLMPASVQAVEICWPLGVAARDTPASMCRVRRSAFVLDGTVPPTLTDRVRPESLRETAWIDARLGLRLRPGCATAQPTSWTAAEFARWPTLLEPWLAAEWRSEIERLPLTPACAAIGPQRALRLTGIENGSTLRPTPGQRAAVVQLQVVGAREGVSWLLDGRQVASVGAQATLRLRLDQPGEHALTAIDGRGRYERVTFALQLR